MGNELKFQRTEKLKSQNGILIPNGRQGRSESARILNDYLDSLQNRINRDFNSFNEKGEEITFARLKDSLMGKDVKRYYLEQIFEMNNALIKKEEGQKYSSSTIGQYATTLERLKLFLFQEFSCNDIALSKLHLLFILHKLRFL